MGTLISAGSEDRPVKRKRGRPRKADVLAAQAAAVGVFGAPPVKRMRGRPRKGEIRAVQAAAAAMGIGAPPVKRKRGRPQKAAAGGAVADDRIVSVPDGNVDGLVSDSGYDSFFTDSSESNSSSDSDYDGDGQAALTVHQGFESNFSFESDYAKDDDSRDSPKLIQSCEYNSGSDTDYYQDDHSSDEDFTYQDGLTRQGAKKTHKDPAAGLICHWCRQRSLRRHVRCSLCVFYFCPACLMNRNGEKVQEETRRNVRWVCPRCRGGCGPGCKNCCNCGPCRKAEGKPPTGPLARTAREAGFSNAHDYLIHLETGESAEVIARRKEGRGWTYATGAFFTFVEVSPIPPWGMKGLRTPKIPLGFLISKCREGREDAMACEMAETARLALPWCRSEEQNVMACDKAETPQLALPWHESEEQNVMACEMTETPQLALPWFESGEQNSGAIQERTGYPSQRSAEVGRENMSTSPGPVECQLSLTNSDVIGSPSRISMDAEETECWRTHGAVPKRKRTVRKRPDRKKELHINEAEHEKSADVNNSLKGEGEEENQAVLPDLNSLCEQDLFELPDLNSPVPTSDGVTNSYSSVQEITGVTTCSESERHVPLSAESGESSFSVKTQLTSENEGEAATSTQATSADETVVATLGAGDDFRVKLDLILQRPFSSEQLKEMWNHFMFHRPSQQEYTHYGSSNGEADELLCDYFADLYEKLARTFSAFEKLKLLRGFFFWLQNSSMEGAFKPWVTEGEDDRLGGCTSISKLDSQAIDRLLTMNGSI
ncbi:unnamed protein product [Calypogeia fissa]